MLHIIVLLSIFLIPTTSWAASNDAVCRVLKKRAETSAEYQSGVDAYGRPVIAAEGSLPALTADLPKRIKVPLSVDLAQKIPSLQQQGIEMSTDLGVIEIDAEGQVYRDEENITKYIDEHCETPTPQELFTMKKQRTGIAPVEIFRMPPQDIAPAAGDEMSNPQLIEVEILSQPNSIARQDSNRIHVEEDYDLIDDLLFGE